MSKNPLNFGVSGIFGRMGQNPSINALTNANAIASQQQAMGNSMMAKPDMSQQIMTGSFDPLTQQVGMGIFGDQNARNMAVMGSGIMMHDDVKSQIEAKKEEIKKAKAEGGDPDIVYELQSDLMDLEKELESAKKAHNSSAIMNIDETPHHVKEAIKQKNIKDAAKPKKPRTRLMSGQQKDAAKVRNVVNAVKAGVKGFLNK